jgi:hypothetical protein
MKEMNNQLIINRGVKSVIASLNRLTRENSKNTIVKYINNFNKDILN